MLSGSDLVILWGTAEPLTASVYPEIRTTFLDPRQMWGIHCIPLRSSKVVMSFY